MNCGIIVLGSKVTVNILFAGSKFSNVFKLIFVVRIHCIGRSNVPPMLNTGYV